MNANYNIRRTRGKKRGQFVKKIVADGRENNAIATMKRLALDREEDKKRLCSRDNEAVEPSRRIVDLYTFGADLYCQQCKIPLSILDQTQENRFGLASVFSVPCTKCNILYEVRTDKRLPTNNGFAVNTVVALGMLDTGVGETHINSLLSIADVPVISPNTLKKYESCELKHLEPARVVIGKKMRIQER